MRVVSSFGKANTRGHSWQNGDMYFRRDLIALKTWRYDVPQYIERY